MPEPLPIRLGPGALGDLGRSETLEWCVADGVGGYTMGTACGMRTRRYHGTIHADPADAGRRWLSLASLDVVLHLPSGTFRLATHRWADGTVAPTGHVLLASFDLDDGIPRWTWRVGETVVQREVVTIRGEPGAVFLHRVLAGGDVDVDLEALGAWRDAHSLRQGGPGPSLTRLPAGSGSGGGGGNRNDERVGGIEVGRAWWLRGPGFAGADVCYRGVHYAEETARGLDDTEDLQLVGVFHTRLGGDRTATVQVSRPGAPLADGPASVGRARARNRQLVAAARDPVEARLVLAADTFVLTDRSQGWGKTAASPTDGTGGAGGTGGSGGTDGAGAAPVSTDGNRIGPVDVVAGYPWFGTWSRDTFTSYEGLFLCTGRLDEGRELLAASLDRLQDGLLPNTADGGFLRFNSVDGLGWLAHALARHLHDRRDPELETLGAARLDAARRVLEEGTGGHGEAGGITVDPGDGLLTAAVPGLAFTWMDAVVDGRPVTGRMGKPVEVDALWLALHRLLAGLAPERSRARRREVADRIAASFAARFPLRGGWVPDHLRRDGTPDWTHRPNGLLAWTLAPPDLPGASATLRSLLETAEESLATPLGLRSLDPGDAGYRGQHRGDQTQRDLAYHQGTVWPWLVGPWARARARLGLPVRPLLDGLVGHLSEWGLGSISETADGDAPHRATGCPFQAWSVAETLVAWRLAQDQETRTAG